MRSTQGTNLRVLSCFWMSQRFRVNVQIVRHGATVEAADGNSSESSRWFSRQDHFYRTSSSFLCGVLYSEFHIIRNESILDDCDDCDDCVGRSSDDLKGLQVRFGSKGSGLPSGLMGAISAPQFSRRARARKVMEPGCNLRLDVETYQKYLSSL